MKAGQPRLQSDIWLIIKQLSRIQKELIELQFPDSQKNQLSMAGPIFPDVVHWPLEKQQGGVNTLYWLDQTPDSYCRDTISRCSNSFTKNRTWQVINLNSLSIDNSPFLLNTFYHSVGDGGRPEESAEIKVITQIEPYGPNISARKLPRQ